MVSMLTLPLGFLHRADLAGPIFDKELRMVGQRRRLVPVVASLFYAGRIALYLLVLLVVYALIASGFVWRATRAFRHRMLWDRKDDS